VPDHTHELSSANLPLSDYGRVARHPSGTPETPIIDCKRGYFFACIARAIAVQSKKAWDSAQYYCSFAYSDLA
jgi:hypothetical protein